MKASVGFLHAGDGSRVATVAALGAHGSEAVHLVDPTLVDASAASFPIDNARYAAVRARARELAERAERIVLSCSVYNGVAPWLAEDLHVPVERSDAAGVRALKATAGPIGVLVSYPPTAPVVIDYITEVFATDELDREVRTSIAPDAPPFTTDEQTYRNALLEAVEPLRGSGVLFVAQFTMNLHLAALHAAWGGPLVSALEALVAELFP